jgi:hypothetical protein
MIFMAAATRIVETIAHPAYPADWLLVSKSWINASSTVGLTCEIAG